MVILVPLFMNTKLISVRNTRSLLLAIYSRPAQCLDIFKRPFCNKMSLHISLKIPRRSVERYRRYLQVPTSFRTYAMHSLSVLRFFFSHYRQLSKFQSKFMIIFQFKSAILNYVLQIVKENLTFRATNVSHWTRSPVSLHFAQKN